MGRLFSFDFNFENQTYTAMVHMAMQESEILFDIKIYDPKLHSILPEGKLTFKGKSGYKYIDSFKYTQSRNLILAITEAIEMHLTKPPFLI